MTPEMTLKPPNNATLPLPISCQCVCVCVFGRLLLYIKNNLSPPNRTKSLSCTRMSLEAINWCSHSFEAKASSRLYSSSTKRYLARFGLFPLLIDRYIIRVEWPQDLLDKLKGMEILIPDLNFTPLHHQLLVANHTEKCWILRSAPMPEASSDH